MRFPVVVAVLLGAFGVLRYSESRQMNDIVGRWQVKEKHGPIEVNMVLTMNSDGTFYGSVSGYIPNYAGVTGNVAGKWKVSANTFQVDLDRANIPNVNLREHYGGWIKVINDKELSYVCKEGTETWRRVGLAHR